jgi:hypothetical protein
MPLSLFAMMDSVMTRSYAVRCGKSRPVVFDTRRVGALRMARSVGAAIVGRVGADAGTIAVVS